MSEHSSSRRHKEQRSHATINCAIGAGLFAAGVGLCVVLSNAPAQSSVEVKADSTTDTVSRTTTGLSLNGGIRVGVGNPNESSPLGPIGLNVGITDPTEGG